MVQITLTSLSSFVAGYLPLFSRFSQEFMTLVQVRDSPHVFACRESSYRLPCHEVVLHKPDRASNAAIFQSVSRRRLLSGMTRECNGCPLRLTLRPNGALIMDHSH